jgi:8-oxo-dGTP pyrophosphatase MutT (NUDIX family)
MSSIRTTALAMIWRGDEFLVSEFDHLDHGGYYYRPLGGGIEFGEYGIDALRRELKEELRSNIADIQYLTTLENLYSYTGIFFHEIILLYQCRLLDTSLYFKDIIFYQDESVGVVSSEHAVWKPLSLFEDGGPMLVPDGLFEYLCRETS